MNSFFVLAGILVAGQDACPSPPAEPPTPERSFLMRSLDGTCTGACLDQSKVQIRGWTEGTFTASSVANDQLPMGFNYLANQFLLQQNWLRVERAIDEKATNATWGFRWDTILPGSDYRFTVARGLFDSQLTQNDGGPNTYGIDPVQFYLESYFPEIGKGLDVKVGRFVCQFGAENTDTNLNALASRSYTFIYNPFTHTGLLTTLKLSDAWSVQNGLVTGSDVFIDPAARPTYIGSVKWAPSKGKDSILFAVILGPGRFETSENFNNPQVLDLIYTHKFSDKLTYAFEGLYGFEGGVPGLGDVNWFGVVQYLSRTITPKLTGNARLEFFDDIDGQRTGFAGLYTTVTAGLAIKPCKDLLIRPEVRYDYNNDSRPFQGQHDLWTAAMNVVLNW